jgi:hypothetical protein
MDRFHEWCFKDPKDHVYGLTSNIGKHPSLHRILVSTWFRERIADIPLSPIVFSQGISCVSLCQPESEAAKTAFSHRFPMIFPLFPFPSDPELPWPEGPASRCGCIEGGRSWGVRFFLPGNNQELNMGISTKHMQTVWDLTWSNMV